MALYTNEIQDNVKKVLYFKGDFEKQFTKQKLKRFSKTIYKDTDF